MLIYFFRKTKCLVCRFLRYANDHLVIIVLTSQIILSQSVNLIEKKSTFLLILDFVGVAHCSNEMVL